MDKGFIKENGTYRASGVLFNGGKWYLRVIREGVWWIFSNGGDIGMVRELCIWVEM